MTDKWRLYYKDSNNDNTVLAGLQDGDLPSSAYTLQKARWKPRARAVDKLSVIGETNLFKNVPREENNDFGTTEPTIFWTGFRQNKTITGVDTTNDEFVVSGDVTNDFEEGGHIEVKDSTGNDGIYKVADDSDVTYDSNNNETTIAVVEDVTDSTADGNLDIWENIFRGFPTSQGKITEQGNVKLRLMGFVKYLGQQEVTVSSTADIQDVMSKLTPSDYSFDSPSSSNVDYIDSTGTTTSGYAPVDNWSLTSTDRAVGFREEIRKYGYVIKAKADKSLRYEPVGFGSSIDTIDSPIEGDTNNTLGKFKEWTAGDTEVANLVNTVRVVNSKSGTKYDSGVITNSSSVNKYGKQTPKGGNPVKVGYVDSDQEAKRVAQNIIRDSQNPTEGGRVKVAGRYTNNVTNSTFTLNDSTRGLNSDTFVCWSQVNFYPENKTILELEYENQSEKETNITDDVRAERSTTFPSNQQDVGGQTIDQSQSNTTTASADNSTNEDDQDPLVDGNTGTSNVTTASNSLTTAEPAAGNSTSTLTLDFISGDTDFSIVNAWIQLNGGQKTSTTTGKDFTITNNDTSNTILSKSAVCAEGNFFQAVDFIDGDIEGDQIEMSVTDNDGIEYSYGFSVAQMAEHTHAGVSDGGSLATALHSHNVDVNDAGHGSPNDPSEHELQGQTETGENIDLSTEDKTDR